MAQQQHSGWVVTQSIALEMDIAVEIGTGSIISLLSDTTTALITRIAAEWKAEWRDMMGNQRSFPSVVGLGAALAGTLAELDYQAATLPIRAMDTAQVLEILTAQADSYGLVPDVQLDLAEQFVDLRVRLELHLYALEGFDYSGRVEILRNNAYFLTRVLRDGDLHARFWHWMDRFYYEAYRPWREEIADVAENYVKHAVTMLGAAQREGEVPNLDWVPQYNPLRTLPKLREAVEAGRYRVMFIATPYEMADYWTLKPGLLVCSFAEEGELYQKFANYAENLAARAKAFADPTRLIIMRMIRAFGMTNTEIADFLGVSRPTISEHVKILREAGFVVSHKEGREMKHAYVNAAIWQFFADLEETLDPAPRPEQD